MTTIDCESPEIVNASRYGRKEGQAFFADFVKENQLRWLPGARSQCRKIILKKLGTAFLFEFLVYIMFWKKQKDFEVPISGLPIFANVANSRSERFSSSEIIRHKFLCQFFAKRGTTCEGRLSFLFAACSLFHPKTSIF